MTAAKEYTIPDLTYSGGQHAGKVMVDRVDYYAAMAREAVLQKRVDLAEGGAHFTCIGKGGDYIDLGVAIGAGTSKGDLAQVYRDTKNGQLFFREPEDFIPRMEPIKPKLQPWVCALCDQQHMDGEVCVEAMARNGVEQ